MARQSRSRYVSGQKLRGANAPQAIAFARAISPEILHESLEDQAVLAQDCKVLAGAAVATALSAMGIHENPNLEPSHSQMGGTTCRR
jgi:hypothetical protein